MFYYQTYRDSSNALVHYKEAVPGSGNFNVKLTGPLPSDAVPALVGSRPLVDYQLEPNGVLNIEQFNSPRYYSPTFKFNPDTGGWLTPSQRRPITNQFTRWNVKESEQALLQEGEGFAFLTENFLTDQASAHGFLLKDSLQDFLTNVWPKVAAMGYGDWAHYRYANYNIEAPLALNPGNVGSTIPGNDEGFYSSRGNPDWNSVANNVIQCENSQRSITLAQLAAEGKPSWEAECNRRFANRMALLGLIMRKKSAPGTKFTLGMTNYISFPSRARRNGTDYFKDAECNVNTIGGVNDTITLTIPGGEQWTVTLRGLPQTVEDFGNITTGMSDAEFLDGEYEKIFIQKLPETQNLPYIWSHQKPWGIFADEKGRIEHNRQRQQVRQGRMYGIYREINGHYETAAYYLPWLTDTRLFYPPYLTYGRYAVPRFYAGDEEGWALHLFPQNPTHPTRDPATDPEMQAYYNMALHSYGAIYQARVDMQFLEAWYPGSTFVKDPDVQIGMAGDWQLYDGIEAFDQYPNPQLPGFMARYKAMEGGTRVVFQGGEKLNWTEERTHNVRLPGGVVGNNIYQLKLRGPGVHLFDFFVPSTVSGQTFIGLNLANPSREKACYAGSVISN